MILQKLILKDKIKSLTSDVLSSVLLVSLFAEKVKPFENKNISSLFSIRYNLDRNDFIQPIVDWSHSLEFSLKTYRIIVIS